MVHQTMATVSLYSKILKSLWLGVSQSSLCVVKCKTLKVCWISFQVKSVSSCNQPSIGWSMKKLTVKFVSDHGLA